MLRMSCGCLMVYYDLPPVDSALYRDFPVGCPKKRREVAHACTFGGNFELKITRMRESCNWKIPVYRGP